MSDDIRGRVLAILRDEYGDFGPEHEELMLKSLAGELTALMLAWRDVVDALKAAFWRVVAR